MRLTDLPRSELQLGQRATSPSTQGSKPGNNQDVGRLNNWKFQDGKTHFPQMCMVWWAFLTRLRPHGDTGVLRGTGKIKGSLQLPYPAASPQVSEEVSVGREAAGRYREALG